MLTAEQQHFLVATYQAAKQAGHIFPEMAACEAADESAWGTSHLAIDANNLFGMKQHAHPVYGSISIPTREFENARWLTVDAEWVKYPDLASCFADRMNTLRTMSTSYPHYSLALGAETPEEYVAQVSQSWSTNPTRAADCIAIYHAHKNLMEAGE
jgi:flagellum-specific peptidoglycan hydrolase FlgJ